MAFPGRPEDKYSAGCNFLIKENIAALTENATDVAHLLGYPIKKTTLQQTILPNFSDDERENELIQLLSEKGTLHIDELCQLTQRPSSELAAILLQLELEGKIIGLAGKNILSGNFITPRETAEILISVLVTDYQQGYISNYQSESKIKVC